MGFEIFADGAVLPAFMVNVYNAKRLDWALALSAPHPIEDEHARTPG